MSCNVGEWTKRRANILACAVDYTGMRSKDTCEKVTNRLVDRLTCWRCGIIMPTDSNCNALDGTSHIRGRLGSMRRRSRVLIVCAVVVEIDEDTSEQKYRDECWRD